MKYFFIYLLFTFSLVICFNFNNEKHISGEVIYTVSLNEIKNPSKEIKSYYKKARNVDYNLVFNSKESKYKKIKSMNSDADGNINMTEIFAGGKNTFYYDASTRENLYSQKGRGETYLITLESYNWKLTKEQKKIGDYNCFKAIALNKNSEESNNIAWYTLDISMGYGPKYFNGLPGLILELNTKQINFKATKIKLFKKEKKIKKPSDGIKITYKEYKKRFSGIFKD
jgi:GLPGLI family protein